MVLEEMHLEFYDPEKKIKKIQKYALRVLKITIWKKVKNKLTEKYRFSSLKAIENKKIFRNIYAYSLEGLEKIILLNPRL